MLHSPDLPQQKAEAVGEEAEPGAGLLEANLRDRLSDIAWPIGVGLGALLLWEALCRGFEVRPILLPPPSAILAAMVTRADLLLANLWPSVYQTVLAFLLSVVGGVLLGILITYSVTVRKGFYPLIVVSQIVPKIAIAPLFIVWFGTGAVSSLLSTPPPAATPMMVMPVAMPTRHHTRGSAPDLRVLIAPHNSRPARTARSASYSCAAG
jgi:NitT/TauT family transport system permease protein